MSLVTNSQTRGRGRPRRADTPKPPAQPQVFLTREQLAERWHCTPQTVSRTYKKLGLYPTHVAGRGIFALGEIERVERERTTGTET